MAHDCDNSGAYKGSYKRKTESKRREVKRDWDLHRDINKAFREFEKARGVEPKTFRQRADEGWARQQRKSNGK